MRMPKFYRCLIYDDCLECGKRTRTRLWMYNFVFCSLKCWCYGTGEQTEEIDREIARGHDVPLRYLLWRSPAA